MKRVLAGIAICLSMAAGVVTLLIDAANRCTLQCLAVPPPDAIRWAGIILLVGPGILLGVVMRCKESFNG